MILLSWERPPRLNQAFDSDRSSGSSIWNNHITRRSFLKKSGGATVAAVILANTVFTEMAEARTVTGESGLTFEISVVSGCPCMVVAVPNDASDGYTETNTIEVNKWGEKFGFKGAYFTNPWIGVGKEASVGIEAQAWKDGVATVYPTQRVTLYGWIGAGCNFNARLDTVDTTDTYQAHIYHDADFMIWPDRNTDTVQDAYLLLQITNVDDSTPDIVTVTGLVYLHFVETTTMTPHDLSLPSTTSTNESWSESIGTVMFVKKVC